MLEDDDLIEWARFVATKFTSNDAGWKYTRDLGELVHVRYRRDYTGYNHWTKRLARAVRAWNPVDYWKPKGWKATLRRGRKTLKGYFIHGYAYSLVQLRKDKNLPDGLLNGNITFWEEDGEYGALMGPTVGVKVLDFLEAQPENPHAVEILTEMRRMVELSFPGEVQEDESS